MPTWWRRAKHTLLTHKDLWGFIFLGLIGLVFRFYQFGAVPTGLNRDEAALGYNAWAVANYGKDEWGVRYPLFFKSFGDYKLPGYIYTLAPLVKVLGVSDAVVRLPSALAGLGLIVCAYLLIKPWWGKRAAAFGAAVLAISPWAIFYSRTAYEANLGLFWLALTLLLLQRPVSLLRLIGTGITYLVSGLTYNAPLLLFPVLIGFIWLGTDTIKAKLLKSLPLTAVAVSLWLLLAPLTAQKQNITLFSDPTYKQWQLQGYAQATHLWEKVYYHHVVYYPAQVLGRFIKTYLPAFLVFKGGSHPWHSFLGRGHFYLTLYLLFIVGVGSLLVRKRLKNPRAWLWLIGAASLPAIITVDAPHATRSLLVFFLISLAAGYALSLSRRALLFGIAALAAEVYLFGYAYFVVFPQESPTPWPKNLHQTLDQTKIIAQPTQTFAFVSAHENYDLGSDQLYIYPLLYLQIPPDTYQATTVWGQPDNAGMVRVKAFDRYVMANSLSEVPPGAVIIEQQDTGEYDIKR